MASGPLRLAAYRAPKVSFSFGVCKGVCIPDDTGVKSLKPASTCGLKDYYPDLCIVNER